MKTIYKIISIVAGLLVLANLGFLDWQYFLVGANHDSPGGNELEFAEKLDYRGLIKDEIEKKLSELPLTAGQSSVLPTVFVPTSKTPTVASQPKIAYVPLVSSGSVFSITWTDITPSEFYFDLNDYPNAKEVRFEAFLQSSNNDLVSARIYDQTNKRGVDFSELQTSTPTFTRIQSSAIKIWRGNNKYTVQLKSVNGTGVQLREAKLIIIF